MNTNWSNNEKNITDFAGLISHKMFYDKQKIPNEIKSYISRYHHFNFATRDFDNLCWLTINNFLMIAFNECNIKHEESKLMEDFNVKGAYMYRQLFTTASDKIEFCQISVNPYGLQPIDSLTREVCSKKAQSRGCFKCKFTALNCSYCANGKLNDVITRYHGYKPFATNGWVILCNIIGRERARALDDLADFYFQCMTKPDFLKEDGDSFTNVTLEEYLNDLEAEEDHDL